jgi:hypothetical protein
VPLHRVPFGRIAPTALVIEGGTNGPSSCALGTTSGILGMAEVGTTPVQRLPMFLLPLFAGEPAPLSLGLKNPVVFLSQCQ